MEPNGAFLLPRPVPTSAGVIFQKPQYPFSQDISEQSIGCAIIRPTVEDTLTLYQKFSSANIVGVGNQAGRSSVTSPNPVTFAPKFVGSNGVPRTKVVNLNDGAMYPKGDTLAFGTEYYDDPITTVDGNLFSVNINPVGWHGNVNLRVYEIDDSVNPPTKTELHVVALQAPGTVNITTDAIINKKITLGLTRASMSEDSGSNFADVSVIALQNLTFGDSTDSYAWKTFSLWELLGHNTGIETLQRQYSSSQRTCVSGFSVLLRNTTASLFKSGSVVAAQMTGGSENQLPSMPDDFYNYVAAYNDPKTYSGQLNKGLHWFFSAEKVQDLFFTPKPYEQARPFLVAAWQCAPVADANSFIGLTLDFRINIECLTSDISMMKFIPSQDPLGLLELYLSLVSLHNPIGENPGHRSKIANIIKKVGSSPLFKETAKRMAIAGVQTIPLMLAAL